MGAVTQASHNDIYREIGAASQQIEALEVRADNHDAMLERLQVGVNENGVTANAVLAALAEMRADVAAIKAKVLAYDILKGNIRWAAATAVTIITAWFASFWAFTGGKIVAFFSGPGVAP